MMNTKKDFRLYDLIEEHFDFSEYSEQEKQHILLDTSGLIMEAALLRALHEGGVTVQEQFDDFMETEPDDESLNEYISKNLPHFDTYIIEEIQAMKDFDAKDFDMLKDSHTEK
jgi:hypothetical protein